ncbi:hypothetical protein H6G00_00340 [Leptolyngbya sp. FACHB-541]|uniref:hypothetical protein n=1 Tax=Leptolyngbya sp. FACHB-541 TaxID=2692810 RepID=UPI00168245B1|nr:hypothetical protein [Leptolyngbya sp. FACHB-541]MBD1995077.1 hypothetical protein [Leptolyngbya sp. FACHB-541]
MLSNRASIRPYLMDYLEQVGSQIGSADTSEIINLIILDHKRGMVASSAAISSNLPEDLSQNSQSHLLTELSELI